MADTSKSIRSQLLGPYRDFTLLAAGATLALVGPLATQVLSAHDAGERIASERALESRKDAAAYVDSVFRYIDDANTKGQVALEAIREAADTAGEHRIAEYDSSVMSWRVAEARLAPHIVLHFDSATAQMLETDVLRMITLSRLFHAKLDAAKAAEASRVARSRLDPRLMATLPPIVRDYMREQQRSLADYAAQQRVLDSTLQGQLSDARTMAVRIHTSLLRSVQVGLVDLSPEETAELTLRRRAYQSPLGMLLYDLGFSPLRWSAGLVVLSWLLFTYLSASIAKRMRRSAALWGAVGFAFGPAALLMLGMFAFRALRTDLTAKRFTDEAGPNAQPTSEAPASPR